MSEDANSTIMRLQSTIANLQKDLQGVRIGREQEDLSWRKLWQKEKARADRAEAALAAERADGVNV